MVDRRLINELGLSPDVLEEQVAEYFTGEETKMLEEVIDSKIGDLTPGNILKGVIAQRIGDDVIVEIGLKSEGIVSSEEFDDPDEIQPGKEIEVLLEEIDDADGTILLSKRKADRIRGWQEVLRTKAEGDVVIGKVTRRIKGGLLIDIGVPVFLPASQVDIRKPGDISRFIGQDMECKILKIDEENRNIVVSRRKIIEEERFESKVQLLKDIEVGQTRKGIVKNIADFGVFVDLGGLDGLLHISDLSWGRISHPSEIVHLDQEIECVVISFDEKNERVSLGLKQKNASPWEDVEQRYPIGGKVKGVVVNIMNYGIFVKLEEGIEGLVHISEMSWTKRIVHPADIFNIDDEIDVVVLDVNKDKQEISLGIKQMEANPWAIASQKYPPGTVVNVKVTSLTNYGAFVEIEPGIDGLVHISDISWTKKYNHPSEALEKGKDLKCVVLEVDEDKQRVSLGVKQLTEDPWEKAIPNNYIPGHIIKGKITKITNFGVFVELEDGLEGLLHISELADHKIDKPQDVVQKDQEVEVKILRVDTDSRKIGLSIRRVQWAAEDQAELGTAVEDGGEAAEETQRRGGLDGAITLNPDDFTQTEDKVEDKAEDKTEDKVEDKAEDKAEDKVEDEVKAEDSSPEQEQKEE